MPPADRSALRKGGWASWLALGLFGLLATAAGVAHDFNNLLTDVVMPEMSATELAERALGLHPEIKVVFMSGYTDDAVVRHGILDTGTPFLQKPFTPSGLARKVREILDKG